MKNRTETSAIVDGILRLVIGGGAIATILVAPGMAKVLDKPTRTYFSNLDKRARERELRRLLYYMKHKGLITLTTEDYEHGLIVTKEGKLRLQQVEFENLTVSKPAKWDNKWRLVFFDIPEQYKRGRRQLINKLKQIGFQQLQRSVWVHPFPCRSEIEQVTSAYGVQKYVSYVEAMGIDSEELLKKRFQTLFKSIKH